MIGGSASNEALAVNETDTGSDIVADSGSTAGDDTIAGDDAIITDDLKPFMRFTNLRPRYLKEVCCPLSRAQIRIQTIV